MSKTSLPDCESCGAKCCKYVAIFEADKEYWDKRIRPEVSAKLGNTGLHALVHNCPYLDENDRCSIYENRPRVCREFPKAFDEDWAKICPEMEKLRPKSPLRIF